jgi:hypothetical protein
MTYFDYIAILLPISSILGLWIANLNRWETQGDGKLRENS